MKAEFSIGAAPSPAIIRAPSNNIRGDAGACADVRRNNPPMASKQTVAIFNGRITRLQEQNHRKTAGEGRIVGDSWKNNRVNCPSCSAAMTALNLEGHS